MTLVDPSAWIDFFRGRGRLSADVDDLLRDNRVALCGPIVTEIRRGLRSSAERRQVLPLLEGCHFLSSPANLWDEAGDLGFTLARAGVTARSMDLLIATYALGHGVTLLTRDGDFARMRRAGVPLQLL
jgi:predicted nucleic acid-binding protein